MSGWTPAVLGLLLVTNPAGVSHLAAWARRGAPDWTRRAAVAVASFTAALAALSLLTGPILDVLDLSVPTFRLGASVVMGLTAARWLVSPWPPVRDVDSDRDGLVQLVLSVLSPGPVFAAMMASADAGAAAGLVSVAITGAACLLALVARRLPDRAGTAAARLVGAAALVVAVAVGIDSARTV